MTSPVFEGLEDVYFSPSSQIYLEAVVPTSKIILANNLSAERYHLFLGNTWFGEVTNPSNDASLQQVFDPRIITDLTVGYDLSDDIKLVVGANNLFDVYPEETIDELRSGGRFTYSRNATQFGMNGRKILARIKLKLANK